jgi:hypothetical protein
MKQRGVKDELGYLYFRKLTAIDQKRVREFLIWSDYINYPESGRPFTVVLDYLTLSQVNMTINWVYNNCQLDCTVFSLEHAIDEIRYEIGL